MSTNKVSTDAQTGAQTGAQTRAGASAHAGGQTEAQGAAPAATRSVTRDTAPEPRLTTQSIRSFVLRQGRMSPAQTLAYETLMPRYGIRYISPASDGAAGSTAPQAPLDFSAVFGRAAPTILEIGSGMGETTAAIAEAMPEKNFIAVEVHTPGVGALLKLIEEKKLANLRVIQHDAVEVVQQMIGADSLAGIHLFFADPWPKARHHKRRIVQPHFVKLLASRLARSTLSGALSGAPSHAAAGTAADPSGGKPGTTPGGYLHCATDWEPYAQHMLEVLSSEPALKNTSAIAPGFCARPACRPITKFETRGIKLGHGVWDLVFTRRT